MRNVQNNADFYMWRCFPKVGTDVAMCGAVNDAQINSA